MENKDDEIKKIRKKCHEYTGKYFAQKTITECLKEELATAKAENGRLAEALKNRCPCWGGESKNPNGHSRNDCHQKKPISTSNALDYWQGEIRKARAEGIRHAAKLMRGMIRDGKEYSNDIIEAEASRQLNQSKGEKGKG